jgi:hypothetical protein
MAIVILLSYGYSSFGEILDRMLLEFFLARFAAKMVYIAAIVQDGVFLFATQFLCTNGVDMKHSTEF